MKKYSLLILAVLVLLAQGVFAEGEETADKELVFLHNNNILIGDPDGGIRAEDEITRAEFVAVLCRAIGIEDLAQSEEMTSKSMYSDVPVGHWAVGYVNAATEYHAINGVGPGLFCPDMPITNEQAIKILVAAWGYGDEAEKSGGYPNGYMEVARQFGITDSVLFNYGTASKRWVVSVFTYNMLSVSPKNITLNLPVRTTIDDEIQARAESRAKYIADPVAVLKKITPETVKYERTVIEQALPYGAPFPFMIDGEMLVYTGPREVQECKVYIGEKGDKRPRITKDLLEKSEIRLSVLQDGQHKSILHIRDGAVDDTFYFTVGVSNGEYEIMEYRTRTTALLVDPQVEQILQVIDITSKDTDIIPFDISVYMEDGKPVLRIFYPEVVKKGEWFLYSFTPESLKSIEKSTDGNDTVLEPMLVRGLEIGTQYATEIDAKKKDFFFSGLKGYLRLFLTEDGGVDFNYQGNYWEYIGHGYKIRE